MYIQELKLNNISIKYVALRQQWVLTKRYDNMDFTVAIADITNNSIYADDDLDALAMLHKCIPNAIQELNNHIERYKRD